MINLTPSFTPRFKPKFTPAAPTAPPSGPQGVASETKLNDPFQINSALDIIFNTAGLKKAYGNASVGARFKALWDMNKKQYWEPMFKGDFKTVGMNTLFAAGEVLDVFGNVIKSVTAPGLDALKDVTYEEAIQVVTAVQDKKAYEYTKPDGTLGYVITMNNNIRHVSAKEYELYEAYVNSGQTVDISKLSTSERLKASIGFGEYGRINYDYNTGSTLTNIVLEIISDPEVWVTAGAALFGKGLAKNADEGLKFFAKNADDIITKAGLDVTSEAAARNIVVQMTDDVIRNKTSKKISQVLRAKTVKIEAGNTALNNVVTDILGDAVKTNKVFNVYKLSDANDAIKYIFAKQGVDASWLKNADVADLLRRSMAKNSNRMNLNVVRALDTLKKGSDKTQSLLIKSALSPTGVYPTYAIAKKAGAGVANLVRHRVVDAAELLSNKFGNRPLLAYVNGDYVAERSSRTIGDMLTDDLKYLYKEADNFRALEKQAVQDMQVLQTWTRRIDLGKGIEQVAEIRRYIRESQGLELEELADTLREVLKKADKPNKILEEYLGFVEELVPSVQRVEALSRKTELAKKAEFVFDRLFADHKQTDSVAADPGLLEAHYKNTSNKVRALIYNAKDGVVPADIAELMEQESDALLRELSAELIALYADPQGRAQIDMFLQVFAQHLEEQNKRIIDNVKELFDVDDLFDPHAVYKIDRYDLDELYRNAPRKKTGKFAAVDKIGLIKQEALEANEIIYKGIDTELTKFISEELPKAFQSILKNIANPTLQNFEEAFRIAKAKLMKSTASLLGELVESSTEGQALVRTFLQEFKNTLEEEVTRVLRQTTSLEDFGVSLYLSPHKRVSTSFKTPDINTFNTEEVIRRFKNKVDAETLSRIDALNLNVLTDTLDAEDLIDAVPEGAFGIFSEQAVKALQAESKRITELFEEAFFRDMFVTVFEDVGHLGEEAVDSLIKAQTAFGENFKKVIGVMERLDDKKYSAVALERIDVAKEISEGIPTVAAGNPEFEEELLNSLEEAFAMLADFKIYVEPPNKSRLNILPEVWEKPEEMLGEDAYSFEGFAQFLEEFVNTPIDSPLYEEMYNDMLQLLDNVSTTLDMLRPKTIVSETNDLSSAAAQKQALVALSLLKSKTNAERIEALKHLNVSEDVAEAFRKNFPTTEDIAERAKLWKEKHVVNIQAGMSTKESYKKLYDEFGDLSALHNLSQDPDFYNPKIIERSLEITDVVQNAIDMLTHEHYNPRVLITKQNKLLAYERLIHIKQENFSTLIEILSNDLVNEIATDIRTGPFSDLIRNIIKDYDSNADVIRVLQEFDFGSAADPALAAANMAPTTEVYRAAVKASDALATFDSMRRLVTSIQNSALDINTKSAFFSTIMKFHKVTVEQFQANPNYWVDQIMAEMPKYTQYTKQYSRKLKLAALVTDPEFAEAIAEVQRTVGVEAGARHTAAADILPTLGVLYKKADDDPILAEKLKDTLVMGLDIEGMNANIESDRNVMHQISFQFQKNKEHIGTSTHTLDDDALRRTIPNRDYLLELKNAAENAAEEGTVDLNTTYRPKADYTHENLDDFYIEHIGKDAGVRSATESDALLNSLKEVHDAVKAHAPIDPVTGKYKVVLVTHNGNNFDLPLLKRKLYSLNLYERAANETKYGFDLHFLDNIETIDTLALLRKADDYYEVVGAEEAYIREKLLHYFSDLGPTSKTFTAMTTSDLNNMTNLMDLLQKNVVEKTGDMNLGGAMQQLQGKIKAAAADIGETIYERKKTLQTQIFPAAIFQDAKYRGAWHKFMKEQMQFSEEEITKRFGKDMSNMGLSAIFAAGGDYQTYAYNYLVDPKAMDRFFIGTFTRTQLGELTVDEARELTKIAKIIGSLADGVRNYEVHANYVEEMNTALIRILDSDPTKFANLKYLRTDGLNIPETWAVLKYVSDKIDAEKKLKVMFNVDSFAALNNEQKGLLLLLKDGRKFENLALDKYEILLNGDSHSITQAYLSSLNDVLNLRKSFEALSELTDEQGLIGGGALIQMKALEPVTEVLTELQEWLLRTAPAEHIPFYEAEQQLTNRLAKQIAKQFIDLSSEDTLRWLTHSKGLAVIPISNFQNLGGSKAYLDFTTKLASKEFAELNIEHVIEGKHVWVYLNRSADLKIRMLDDGKIVHYANGNIIEDITRSRYSAELFQDVYDGVVSGPTLQKAIDAVDYITDNAANGTVYDMLNKAAFDEIYKMLPQAVQDSFYGREFFDNTLLWQNRFNYTVLGDLSARKELGLSYNGHFLSALRNVTESRINERGVKQIYELSLLNNAGAIRGSRLEEVFQTDQRNVLKWFSENPDYTAVALVKDKHHKQGYKIIECKLNTAGGIKKALDLDAKVVTYSEYNKLYEVINQNLFSENAGRGWQSILRMFKIGYLASPGTWGRNYLDTFIKNMEATGADPLTMGRQYASATKLIGAYDDAIITLRKIGGGRLPPKGQIELFFKNNPDMDYDTYKMLTSFFSDPAAGGEASLFTKLNAQSRKNFMKEIASAGSITSAEYTKQVVKSEFDQITNWALAPMNKVERVARLATYLSLSEKGHTSNTALRMVEKIHFAYSVKSETEQMLEMVVPFFTFVGRNFSYWMDAIDTNPAYFALLRDVLDPAMNLEQYNSEELRNNASLQRTVLSGNIQVPMTDDFYFSISLSFMDALKYIVNPVDQALGSVFTPAQAFINIWLQDAADENYLQGQEALSAWLQNTFGLKMTVEEVNAKYGEWAEEYKKLYDYRISNLDPTASALKDYNLTQIIPLIGSQLQRLDNTSVYYDDDNVLKKTMYLLGIATKSNRWDDVRISKAINQDLGSTINQDKHAMAVYTRLKAAMGYSGVSLTALPYAVKENIFALMNGVEMPFELLPVIKDKDAMQFMWVALKQKYDVAHIPVDEIDRSTLNKIYFEVAKSASYVVSIQDMLTNDPESRYGYAVARNKLGLEGLKVYQMPVEVLEVISFAMENKLYKPRTASTFNRTPRGSSKSYPKKTYSGGEGPGSRTGYFGVTPYDTSKGVHANYGQAYAQKEIRKYSKNIYTDNYTRTGKSRMELMMIPISPETLKYRRKEMYHYYR